MLEYLTFKNDAYGEVRVGRVYTNILFEPKTSAKVLGFKDPTEAINKYCRYSRGDEMIRDKELLELVMAAKMPQALGPIIWLTYNILGAVNDMRHKMVSDMKNPKHKFALEFEAQMSETNITRVLFALVNKSKVPIVYKKLLIFTAMELQVGIGVIPHLFNFYEVFTQDELDWLAETNTELLKHLHKLFHIAEKPIKSID